MLTSGDVGWAGGAPAAATVVVVVVVIVPLVVVWVDVAVVVVVLPSSSTEGCISGDLGRAGCEHEDERAAKSATSERRWPTTACVYDSSSADTPAQSCFNHRTRDGR